MTAARRRGRASSQPAVVPDAGSARRLPAHRAGGGPDPLADPLADLTVIVPVRDAEAVLPECLASVAAQDPGALVVVDGLSSDRTLEIARRYTSRILSDEGHGLPVARTLGAQAAPTTLVALVDADVVLPPGSLEALVEEFRAGGYIALQAGLHSVGGPGYWGRALANHHRTGRSRHWFGLVATVLERQTLLEHGFDREFRSGEDIDLRWRLRRNGLIGVSRRTVVTHRFAADDFAFAREQWLMDGRGLGAMVAKNGLAAAHLGLLPAAAALRGIARSLLVLEPAWVPYYVCFAAYNYLGMVSRLASRSR